MDRTRSADRGPVFGLLVEQRTGILCAFASAALLAAGSLIIDRSPDLYAGLGMDDLRFFFRPWRWQHGWFYALALVLALWGTSAVLCAYDTVLGLWRRRAKTLALYGPPIIHLVFAGALVAHLWGGLSASSRRFVVSDAGTDIDGTRYRAVGLDISRQPSGMPRTVVAVIERTTGAATEEVRVGYNQPRISAAGARELMLGEFDSVADGVVLRHRGREVAVRPGQIAGVGPDAIAVLRLHDPGTNPSLRLPVVELAVEGRRKLLGVGENDGETAFLELRVSPVVELVERNNPSVPLALVLSLLLAFGVGLVAWPRLRTISRRNGPKRGRLTHGRGSASLPDMADLPRLIDLHSHYAMHFYPDGRNDELRGKQHFADRLARFTRPSDFVKTELLKIGNELLNYHEGHPRVTVETLSDANVGVALSPLHQFLDEIELDDFKVHLVQEHGHPEFQLTWEEPDSDYFKNVLGQMDLVNERLRGDHPDRADVAPDWRALEANWNAGKLSIVHALEGGFSLGATEDEVRANVRELADRGVVYITVAHLFYRRVATNSAAIPQLEDAVYHQHFPQPPDVGLTELGRAVVETMLEEGVFVDVTHMSDAALEETLKLMHEKDPGGRIPVMATHVAYRFASQDPEKPDPGREYNLTDEQIKAIVRRKSLIGIILCNVDLSRNLPPLTTAEYVCTHIQRIADVIEQAGIPSDEKYDYLAIGTDLDGYVKPPQDDDTPALLNGIVSALERRLGPEVAAKIAHGNALRVLKSGFDAHEATTPPGERVPWAPRAG
jgi:microsomal dipeptidase-like Zn-dependent dipeptidase